MLFEVRLENLTDYSQHGILWFDVNLSGLEDVRPVLFPRYTNIAMPMEGEIDASDVMIFHGNAWPLSDVPRGLYIFWAKIGHGEDASGNIVIDAKSSFHGTILGEPSRDQYMPEEDGGAWNSENSTGIPGRPFDGGSTGWHPRGTRDLRVASTHDLP